LSIEPSWYKDGTTKPRSIKTNKLRGYPRTLPEVANQAITARRRYAPSKSIT
jgi:hypothetical protein